MSTSLLTVFVGDVTSDCQQAAVSVDSKAYLVDDTNISSQHTGTVYTSLGDLSLKNFFNLLCRANLIIYTPPDYWSDRKTNKDDFSMAWLSEHYIRLASVLHNIEAKNVPLKKTGTRIPLKRKTDAPVIWIAGCSTTYGVGVETGARYQDIIKESLGLETIDLSLPSTSISWSRDQILKSDIRENDIVIWGLTSINRCSWFDGETLQLIHARYYQLHPEFDKVIPLSTLASKHRVYEAVSSVDQVANFCKKINAHLIIANIHGDIEILADCAKHKGFVMIHGTNGTDFSSSFLDTGNDGLHPGEDTHKFYATKILEKINDLKIGSTT